MIHDGDVLSRPSRLPTAQFGDEEVFFHKANGEYVFLDAVAARIWQLLKNEQSFSELLSKLQEEFEVDQETCRTDVAEFLQTLSAKKLVVIRTNVST